MGTDSVRYLMMPKMANRSSAKPIFNEAKQKLKEYALMLINVKVEIIVASFCFRVIKN